MNKFLEIIKDLSWTLGGTALVLITLSGKTQTLGYWISGISLAVYIAVAVSIKDE